MPTKKKGAVSKPLELEETLEEESPKPDASLSMQMFPSVRSPLIETNAALRRVGLIMQHGARFANHAQISFGVHHSYLNQLQQAYDVRAKDTEAPERFWRLLRQYLHEAQQHIPHALASSAAIDLALSQLQALVGQVEGEGYQDAFGQVAAYLLLLAKAPMAHF